MQSRIKETLTIIYKGLLRKKEFVLITSELEQMPDLCSRTFWIVSDGRNLIVSELEHF